MKKNHNTKEKRTKSNKKKKNCKKISQTTLTYPRPQFSINKTCILSQVINNLKKNCKN